MENLIQLRFLTNFELSLLLSDINAFENHMNLVYDGEPLEGHLRNVFFGLVSKANSDTKNSVFHRLCLVVIADKNTIVGSLALKGSPDVNGLVEVGYGIAKDYQGRGFMTEALRQFCFHMFSHGKIRTIMAHTDKDNLASQKVLIRNGFLLHQSFDTELEWILTK